MDDELEVFRSSIREFIAGEFQPRVETWRTQLHPERQDWLAAGDFGLLLVDVPAEYGGLGGGFEHFSVVLEELADAGINFGVMVQSVVARYILAYGTEAQKQRWLPRMASGELIASIAMSEPGAGSDLQGIKTHAVRTAAGYVVNGSKTFVTNGFLANLVCVAVKTDPQASGSKGISLLVVETAQCAGVTSGEPLHKLGMHELDTTELYFSDVTVPLDHLLGPVEGQGMSQMMSQLPYERLAIAVQALATSECALNLTARYVKDRVAFGKPLIEFQNTRFVLAECKASIAVGRAYVDQCIGSQLAGQLDPVDAAMAKYWLTECQAKTMDACLQLHGGYGYMTEYPIARMWADCRMQRIGGGTTEIMKEVIGWSV